MLTKYEKQVDDVVRIARKYLKDPVTKIVEIGARDCNETLAFNRAFPDASIRSFECNPNMLPVCRKAVAHIENITLIEKAVSDREGTMNFNIYPDDPGSSSALLHLRTETKTVQVPMTTLAHELDSAPDILWMDSQGSELNILKGAASMLKDIKLIHSEVYFYPAYQNQPLYKDIREYLNSKGFSLLTFTTRGKDFGDAVFIHKSIYHRKTPQIVTETYHYASEKVRGKSRVLRARLFGKKL